MNAWLITAAGHAVIVVAYAWITVVVYRGLRRNANWKDNFLALATFAIFFTCAIGHAVHLEHAIFGALLSEPIIEEAAKVQLADPILIAWTVVTALFGAWYLSNRGRFAVVHGGAALCADISQRQQQAAVIQREVGARVEQAMKALHDGDQAGAMIQIDEATRAAKSITSMLLDPSTRLNPIEPGSLRRAEAP